MHSLFTAANIDLAWTFLSPEVIITSNNFGSLHISENAQSGVNPFLSSLSAIESIPFK